MSKLTTPDEKIECIFNNVKLNKKRKAKHPKEPHKWYENKAEASRLCDVSRPIVDKILKRWGRKGYLPAKAKGKKPKWFEDFEKTAIAPKIKAYYWKPELGRMSDRGQAVYSAIRRAAHIIARLKGRKGVQDPQTFTLKDYLVFWGTPEHPPHLDFVDPKTKKIHAAKASALKMCMRFAGRKDLVDHPQLPSKGLAREPSKLGWYLRTNHIFKLINAIREVDTLLLFIVGVAFGGRFSALAGKRILGRMVGGIRVKNIDYDAEIIDLTEPKVGGKTFPRLVPTRSILDFLKMYIDDFKIKGRLFHWGIREYNKRFRKAGEEAGLPFKVTSHILKHTCVTQMSLHGVDIDVISDYVGTEERTLKKFYRGGGEKKIRMQIRGEKPKVAIPTWSDFVNELVGYALDRYMKIKPMSIK